MARLRTDEVGRIRKWMRGFHRGRYRTRRKGHLRDCDDRESEAGGVTRCLAEIQEKVIPPSRPIISQQSMIYLLKSKYFPCISVCLVAHVFADIAQHRVAETAYIYSPPEQHPHTCCTSKDGFKLPVDHRSNRLQSPR